MLDSRLVRGEREKQLMEAAHVFPRLRRAVLAHVLRQSQHQALAVVKDINLLPLTLGEIECRNQSHRDHHRAHRHEHYPEQTYLAERRFYVPE